MGKLARVLAKVTNVVDGFVPTEGNVKEPARVEPTQTVKAGAIEVVKERCRLRRVRLVCLDKRVKEISLLEVEVALIR